ncbi:plasmid mobilization relaxosome protein MobC [Myroides sp. N17-2]|uniref:plasmid mobilization protein n=1 Tax=Myroides sp. N17-2 TaxID=2030799 RepID=UPI000EFB2A03|nr:plasmid mobilization relaxosome protein MobC [Myroides sp. N17-2]
MQTTSKNKGGRKQKSNPKKHRHVFRLTESENQRLLTLFASSGMANKANFLVSLLLDREITTVKVDVGVLQYHTLLTKLFNQFKAVGVNYNQIVKLCNQYFSQDRAKRSISRLEEYTKDLTKLCYYIIKLSKEFEEKHLNSKGKV